MKKLIFALLIGCTGFAQAYQGGTVNIGSFTKTNDTTACIISSGPLNDWPHFLNKVIVAGASATGAIVIYSSTWTNTPIISSITLSTQGTYNFDDMKVNGICYTTTGNTNGVSIIYKR